MTCPRCKRKDVWSSRMILYDLKTDEKLQVITNLSCPCGYEMHRPYKGPNYSAKKDRRSRFIHAQDGAGLDNGTYQGEVSSGRLGEKPNDLPALSDGAEQAKRTAATASSARDGVKEHVANAEVVAGNGKPAVHKSDTGGTRSSFGSSSPYDEGKADTSEQLIYDYGT